MSDAGDEMKQRGGLSRRDLLRAGAAGAATVGAGGLLAACGGASSTTTPSTTPAGGSKPKPGGRFRLGQTGSQPQPLDAQTLGDDTAKYLTYEQLTGINPDASSDAGLAESWEPNKDATAWTIHVRKGAEFHNGKSLTADDVVFSLRRILNPKTGAAGAVTLGTVDAKGIKKLDKHTVLVPLKTANAVLPQLTTEVFNFIVPEGYDPRNPVGTGPYKVVKHTPGQRTQLTRFENYWGKRGNFDEIVVIYIDDQTARLNALLSGQLDAVAQLAPSQIPQVESQRNLKLLSGAGGGWTPFMFGVDGEFADDRVRQAMRLLADRDQMIKVAMGGHAQIAYDIYGKGYPGFDASLKRERDLEQAKSLLKQAGKSDLSFDLTFTPSRSGMVEAAQVFSQNCAQAGVTAKVRQVDVGTYYGRPRWPASIEAWFGAPIMVAATISDTKDAPYNQTGWADAGYNAAYQAALKETDEAKRTQHIHDMLVAQFERGPVMIPYFLNNLAATTSKVAGINATDIPGTNHLARQLGLGYFV